MTKIDLLTREDLLKHVENIDKETKQYCISDCVSCWDTKDLWMYRPHALIDENNELLCVVFWSVENVGLEQIVYVQRLFTPIKHRNKGHFTTLIGEVYKDFFDIGFKHMKLFIKKNVAIYKELNFVSLFNTKDGEYEFCMQPILFNELKKNNEIVAKNGVAGFFSPPIVEYIEDIKQKYT